MSVLRYPYTDLHTLNLDWIIEQLNKEGAVLSVNDKHGIVVLTGEDIPRSVNNSQTIEQALTAQGSSIQTVRNQIGTTALPTIAQTITGAIAENAGEIANQEDLIGSTALPTTAQTLTGAIAENAGEIANQEVLIGSTALPTTAQTLTGAIAENAGDIDNIDNKIGNTVLPTTAQTITGAVDELNTKITTDLTGSITWGNATSLELSNCSAYNSIGVRIWKRGKLVILALNVQELTANARTLIASIPSGYRPLMTATFFGGAGLSYSNKSFITVDVSGGLYVLSDDTYANGYIVYYAA